MTTVSIVRVEGRDRERVIAGVRRAVRLAGGLGGRIRPGMLVLVKPNMVGPPASAEAGACTSPLVCHAVADLVRELRARPIIAESSARGADTEAAYRIMGFEAAEVPITKAAALRGLGTLDPVQIEVAGESIAAVRRRFLRCEEDHRIDRAGITIVHSEGTCTGCRNGLLSSLFDMRADGTLNRARGMTIIAGPTAIPEGIPREMLVSIGTCSLPEARRLPRHVRGCPPNNVDIIAEITSVLSQE